MAHAATSKLTEQPSFYIILCGGREGENKVGDHECTFTIPPNGEEEDSSLRVQYLDRSLYPNGNVDNMWDSDNITENFPELVILQ